MGLLGWFIDMCCFPWLVSRKKACCPSMFFMLIIGIFAGTMTYELVKLHWPSSGETPEVPAAYNDMFDNDFQEDPPTMTKNEIIVLRWTKRFESHVHRSPMLFSHGEQCRYLIEPDNTSSLYGNCRITYDRRYLKRSHAVIFHMWNLLSNDLQHVKEEMPDEHPRKQIWIYENSEPPTYKDYVGPLMLEKQFNWTMSYRKDADIVQSYGFLYKLVRGDQSGFDYGYLQSLTAGKSGIAAMIMNNKDCKTASQLKKYVSVDVFGEGEGRHCGNQKCRFIYPACYEDIAMHYKFYLSFESAVCEDYVTEMFYDALAQNIVPVVFGGADYSAAAPPHSYIDVRNYSSPRELAEYLKYLDWNMEAYLKYFAWKEHYRVIRVPDNVCGLCQRVYNGYYMQNRKDGLRKEKIHPGFVMKTYVNVTEWWKFKRVSGDNREPACKNVTMMDFMREC